MADVPWKLWKTTLTLLLGKEDPLSLSQAWKRRISQLEEEVETLQGSQQKKLAGRCIRRLVSLTARVEDLVGESDRRVCLDDFEDQHTKEQDRLFKAYNKLLNHQPSLRRCSSPRMRANFQMSSKRLNKGAVLLAVMMRLASKPEEPALRSDEKDGEGLIMRVNFLVKQINFLLVERHSSRSSSSPTSVLKMDDEPSPRKRRRHDERRTRSHMASLLGMKSVCPRAVAYAAVQLRFALSSCGAWRVVDGEFN
ncbi:hypothetical protein EDC04DRAFT_2604561 [Pisolithus marmoratus]|nr:hypothetical protein EDC04DRAFT_2604561 [Pisolithus marmoratus]